MRVILGIDPGYARVGYGVIREDIRRFEVLNYGCIITSPKDGPQATRLHLIYQEINQIIKTHNPDAMAIEELFFSRNTTTALLVSEARGVILLAAASHGIDVFEYKPNQVKLAITGSGTADKDQMQTMIQRLLYLSEKPKPDDAADGLSLALCHLNRMRRYS